MAPRNRNNPLPPRHQLPGYLGGTVDPDIPDRTTHTAGWIQATDRIAKRRYDPSLPLELDFRRDQPDSFYEGMVNEDVLQEIIDSRRIACSSQVNLSYMAVSLLIEEDFEPKWLALGKTGQLSHFLTAFRELTAMDDPMGPMHSGKTNAPELCYDNISRDGGWGFLDLLKLFLLDNNDVTPTQPFILVNPRFDALIGYKENDKCKDRKAMLELRRLIRSQYISGFLGSVLMSYQGRKPQVVKFTHEHHKTKGTLEEMKPILDDLMGTSAGNKFRKEEALRRKEMKLFCSTCRKPEEKAENGKMSACRPCKAIGREVRYCDKVCQKAAWASHKKECGKPLDLSHAFGEVTPFIEHSGPTARPDIPAVLPGFRRSPHLIQLITYMNEYPKKDYLIMLPASPNDDPRYSPEFEAITLDLLQGAAVFIVMRNRVMKGVSSAEGVESALFYVFRVLQRSSGDLEGPIKVQLAKEYGAVWERVWAALEAGRPYTNVREVTREEVDEALGWLKAAGRFESELEGYEPGTGPSRMCGVQVGEKRDVTAIVHFPNVLI